MIVFMGTPELATPCLRRLAEQEAGAVLVVTQPDRPRGRSGRPQPPPVKVVAQELGLEVFQPGRVNRAEAVAKLAAAEPEFIVVVAYGEILRRPVLDLPTRGCLNVHFSLLPKYRGAAPVHWAIIRGETETGVTTMRMEEGLDTGDLLLQRKVPIAPDDTSATLAMRLAALAPEALQATLVGLRAGTLQPRPQDQAQATWAPPLTKEDGRLRWTESAPEIDRRVRGTTPWPGAFTTHQGRRLKVWEVEIVNNFSAAGGIPGEVVEIRKNQGIIVCAQSGAVLLKLVQPEGGKRIRGDEYATGRGLRVGQILGP